MKKILVVLILITCGLCAYTQETLPDFTVEDKGGGRIIVSWRNPYENLIQIAVQRSYDSIKRFSTVYSSTSPELPTNGYSDKIVPGIRMYYRVFYVMKGGTYYFTKSKRASSFGEAVAVINDARRDQISDELIDDLKHPDSAVKAMKFTVKLPDDAWQTFNSNELLAFRDSVLANTRDTLFQLTDDSLLLSRYSPPFSQNTSEYIFTDNEGYIIIKLNDAGTKKYQVNFFEEDGSPVLEIKPKDGYLILDKTNFYHGGWYKFEIKDQGKIVERNRVFLPREF